MDKVYKASPPVVAEGALLSNPILTLDELSAAGGCVKPSGPWTKYGTSGHYKLPLYFDDNKSGKGRTLWVQFKGHSKWGLGFYKGGDESTDCKKHKQLTFDYDSSPEVQDLSGTLDLITTGLITSTEKELRQKLPVYKNSTIV